MKNRTRTFLITGIAPALLSVTGCSHRQEYPNILFVISDDQSWPYASAYGSRCVETPGFDFVAEHGALFTNAYVTSPGSSPSRASILTGKYPWQLEEAGTHASSFPMEYECFPDIFHEYGYITGYTGKGWGPGDWKISGRPHNPAGPEYNELRLDPPYSGISSVDYFSNFKKFLDSREPGTPFCFWLGGHEPHRPYENRSWAKEGRDTGSAEVPGFLPETDEVRSDILDYAVEIEWFDSHLYRCIEELRIRGELDNTIIIVTADNGMSFPHAKANCYDPGLHVPLAICYSGKWKNSTVIEETVSSIDLFPTLLEAAGIECPGDIVPEGQSLIPLLENNGKGWTEEDIFAGRERHSCSRKDNLGYPVRCIRSGKWLLVHNFHPERYPAGDPMAFDKDGRLVQAYYDIDAAPSKSYLLEYGREPDVAPYFNAAVALRPEYELYDVENDPQCMENLADEKSHSDVLERLKAKLGKKLYDTADPRTGDNPEIWESYPRLEGKMRQFPD